MLPVNHSSTSCLECEDGVIVRSHFSFECLVLLYLSLRVEGKETEGEGVRGSRGRLHAMARDCYERCDRVAERLRAFRMAKSFPRINCF